jgi:uncharacterized protein YqeY
MQTDAASELKTRLRADLREAMKARNTLEARVIRSLVAALDNAEAPAVTESQPGSVRHQFAAGSAEVERLLLDGPQVRDVVRAESEERERAAAEFDRLGLPDRAAELREEAEVVRRYLA